MEKLKYKFTKEHKRKISSSLKNRQSNTIIERIMKQKLKENNIIATHQFPFYHFVCDFAIPDKKILIECDGDYWHNREDVKKKDKVKNAYVKKLGWKMLRFWGYEIHNNIDECINIIKEEICKN